MSSVIFAYFTWVNYFETKKREYYPKPIFLTNCWYLGSERKPS